MLFVEWPKIHTGIAWELRPTPSNSKRPVLSSGDCIGYNDDDYDDNICVKQKLKPADAAGKS